MQSDSTSPETIGKRGRTGLHGNQRRGRRVEYVAVTCEVCGVVREYPPGVLRVRKRIRYCSLACRDAGQVQPEKHVRCVCPTCGREFDRLAFRVKGNAYCSNACAWAAKRVDGAKWRDPAQIKAYQAEYQRRNRERINRQSQEWKRKNREVANDMQRRRRAAGGGGGTWGRLRKQLIALYGEVCLACGSVDGIQIDHVLPVALGGASDLDNLQLLCGPCNRAKSATYADYRP